jgi:DNA-binding Xre family transcriptional regulator
MSVDRVARKRELEEDVGLSRSSLVAASKLKTLKQIVGM